VRIAVDVAGAVGGYYGTHLVLVRAKIRANSGDIFLVIDGSSEGGRLAAWQGWHDWFAWN
jgi:hypothetical protein